MAVAYPGFCSMKQLRVLPLPPGSDTSPSQGFPQQYVAGIHFVHLGEERQCWVKYLVQGNNTMAVHRQAALFFNGTIYSALKGYKCSLYNSIMPWLMDQLF